MQSKLADTTNTPDLVRATKQGDKTAFESLYRQKVGRVYAICLRMLADSVKAEEVTQEVFVRVWERIGTFRGDGAFDGWLRRLTVNAALLNIRQHQRRNGKVVTQGDLSAVDPEDGQSSPGIRLDLEAAIAGLPEQARLVLVLHDIEGYKHTEIAEIMKIAVGTTKAHLFRARKLMRNALES